MEPDTELETWRGHWQAQDSVPQDLKERVEREIRVRHVARVSAVLVTVVFGLGIPLWAITSRRPDVAVLAAVVWVFITINWIVARTLDRGLSRPTTSTTAAFLDFSILSCERRRRAITATSILYAAMLTFNLAWIYNAQRAVVGVAAFLTSSRVVFVLVVTLALAALAVWHRRRLARELQNLVELRRQAEG